MLNCDISKIPQNPWVYLFKDRKWAILYIGKAKNLQKRLWQYFSPTSLRKQEMLDKATKVDFLIVKNESEALYLEDNLIKQHQPEYNNLLKADNSYVYIKITKEQFPQIFLTRKKINDGSLYIGPKNDTIQLKKFLQYLRQILKFRGCKATQFKQGKLCSDYYFGLCMWWCTKKIQHSTSDIQNYDEVIKSFFKWNTKPIEHEIYEQIEAVITHENFEWAAQLRDIYTSLQGFVERQDVVLPEKKDGYLALVKNIWTQFIYTVLVFTQGKLMDVITSKEQQNDIEEDSLHLAIQRNFGSGIVKKISKTDTQIIWNLQSKSSGIISESSRIISESSGIFWKNLLKSLLKLAENFLESYIISQSLQEESTLINDMFKTLKARYGLKNIPYRIECIDISHLSGWRTSGWLSCLMAWLPYKKWYRRYKIHSKKSDDYEALQEVVERRAKNGWELPDLLILDGGKGQLNVIRKLCKDPERKKIVSQKDIISLGKWEARTKSKIWKTSDKSDKKIHLASSIMHHASNMESKIIWEKIYYFDSKLNIHSQAMTYDQADKILLKARNEAHRFANSYRKKQMSQEFKK